MVIVQWYVKGKHKTFCSVNALFVLLFTPAVEWGWTEQWGEEHHRVCRPPHPPLPPALLAAQVKQQQQDQELDAHVKCAAGGRKYEAVSSGENKLLCGKSTRLWEQRGRSPPCPGLHGPLRRTWSLCPNPSPSPSPPPPLRYTQRRKEEALLFIGSCSARMMSIRELSRECMLRLSYILERSWKKTGRGEVLTRQWGGGAGGSALPKRSTHVIDEGLIPRVSSTRSRFGSEIIKPLKVWVFGLTCKRFMRMSSSHLD